ncbi:hypothetical protein [Hubei Wuhan insect virus 9]|uniref:hypothetical protein n=1 Tax=Hubei Wuhan insect virus 9 TaxID=1922833 RepID=UPI0009094C25|nr:hypothetical protein [Hubei Wuhan insect virus 9]APG77667.1 hypothetical protein [Hubei Wuhan insect virus 9]
MPNTRKTLVFTNKNYKNNNVNTIQRGRKFNKQRRSRSRTPRRSISRSRSRSRTSIRKNIKYGPIDGFLHRIWSKSTSLIIDPYTYIGIIIFSILIYIHQFHIDDSAVNSFIKTVKKNDSLKPFADWFENNINKFFALIMVLYQSLQISPKYRYFTTLISFMLILLLPTLNVATYSMALFGSILYHKMKYKMDKIVILSIFLLAAIWFYYEDLMKYHNKNINPSVRPKRDADDVIEA